ncbi:hypothetical protein CR513_19830, partial [Mucuna pruriens]
MDRNMIDAASGGALMDKTPVATRYLILNMASSTQQFGTRGAVISRVVKEVGTIDNLRLENQLIELASLVRQFASALLRVCGICTSVEHPTYMCPTLQETELDNVESVGAISGYQYGRQSYSSWQYDSQQFRRKQYQLKQLSAANSKISGTIILPTIETIGSTMGQFTFNGRVDEEDE